MPVYLYLILPAWLNLWEAPVLAETPPAETKAERDNPLCTADTQTRHKKTSHLTKTPAHPYKIKQARA